MKAMKNLLYWRFGWRVFAGRVLFCTIMIPPIGCFGQGKASESSDGIVAKTNDQQASSGKTDLLGDALPPDALLRLGTNRFSPPSALELMLSADEQIVITVGEKLMAWDANTGKLLWTKSTNIPRGVGAISASYGCRRLCRMPNSGQLVTAAHPGAIELWDFTTGETTSVQTETKENFKSIDVSQDETLFALGAEKMLLVCDRLGKEKYRVENHPKKGIQAQNNRDRMTFGGEYSYGRFTPDGKLLAMVNSENPLTIQLLDSATGEVKRKIETTGRVVRMDFSNDSRHIATTERDIAARTYSIGTGEKVWEKVFSIPGLDERYTTDIEYSPTGDVLAVGTAIGEDQRIQLLDPKTGDGIGALKGHIWKPWDLQFTRDGKRMFSCGWDSVVRRWDIEKREQITIENSERASSVCAMAPNGTTITFCDDSGKLHIVASDSGEKIKTLEFPGAANAQVIYSQDSKLLAGGGASENDIHVYVWDLASFDVKHHWHWPKGRDVHSSVEAMSFSRDANRLGVAVFRQSSCYVFDLPSDKQIVKVRHPSVYGMCMSPDGQLFISAGWDKKLCLWACDTSENVKTVDVQGAANNGRGDDTRMYGALFSPDGKNIATLGMSSDIRVWNLNLEQSKEFRMEAGVSYGSFEFSRNGLWLAVGHGGGKAAIYDVRAGETVWSKDEHHDTIYNVDFGAHDRTLLTGGEDGVCYLWDLNAAANNKPYDFEKLANDLVGQSPRDAFAAYQCLAAEPEQALPAIQAVIESMFVNWGEPNDEELAELNHRVNRVAMWLAETESPAAGQLLDSMLKTSPNGTIKKTLFLASRQRERFLERIGKPVEK